MEKACLLCMAPLDAWTMLESAWTSTGAVRVGWPWVVVVGVPSLVIDPLEAA